MIDKKSGDDREPQTKPLPVDAASQRARILHYLRTVGPLTTNEARARLGIMHPAARIQELRERDNNIITYRETEGRHRRVARYVLLSDSNG